ncbi:NAC domain-containing protein 90-like [Curcuma longa]|uniref:NAC domain-containing protein 90-like n=1 Tax=Curcuma longa TaxID=136217 RepID=UPI003D9EB1EA
MSTAAPPGFRFYPTEDELIGFFLRHKLDRRRESDIARVIPVADVYTVDPWRLPSMAGEACRADGEQWFFFCPRQAREAHGGRPTRTTPSGYWKATGSPSFVFSSAENNPALGVKRTMAFYRGRAPTGTKTEWKLNEYRALADHPGGAASLTSLIFHSEFSVCRVYTNSGCVRAFDRRPVGGARTVAPALASSFDGDSSVLRRSAGGEVDDSYMACVPECV